MVVRRITQFVLRNSTLLRDNRHIVLLKANNPFVQSSRFISITSNVSVHLSW